MNGFRKWLWARLIAREGSNRRTTLTRAVAISMMLAGVAFTFTARAEGPEPFRFNLVATSSTCFPHASAKVTVLPKEEVRGVDTLDLRAEGLPPYTSFTVFLTELADIPFGASEYIAEFTTNAAGKGSVRVDAVINEAFAFDGTTHVRKDLDHVVVWFADPKDDDVCFGTGGGPVTPFDGDGEAGATVLSSKNFLPGAPLR
nr:hypothetical protein Hi04_10k_c4711_00011 [uncultured bacterium]